MKIKVIVPVVNLWHEYTKRCIDSLRTQTLPFGYEIKIHIIDNGSSDDTESKCLQDKSLIYTRWRENKGVSKAWNYGLLTGLEEKFDYYFIINNDTLFQKYCISSLIKKFDTDEKIVMAFAVNYGTDDFSKVVIGEATNHDYSAFMVSKKFIYTLGLFDENFSPAYFEDNCMDYRLRKSEFLGFSVPEAVFCHYGSKTQYQAGKTLVPSELFERNRAYYIKKWGGNPGQERFNTPFDK